MNCRSHPSNPRRRIVAMTLLEIMVAVSLLSLIVLTLYNMFDRTQKALRGTRNQSDVAEAGRAGMDTMCREIQQSRPMASTSIINVYMDTRFTGNSYSVGANSNSLQTNILMELFFHNFVPQSSPQVWTGIGYRVADSSDPRLVPANGVGTLWRFVASGARATNALFASYINAITPASTNLFQRVCDGVIHFNVRPYTNGAPLNATFPYTLADTQMLSHVEVELGIVPPNLLDQAKAFPSASAQIAYLSSKGDKMQMFRQLVSIQTSAR